MDEQKITRLQRIVDVVLATFLIGLIFTFGIMTVVPNVKQLYNSARLMSELEDYLPDDYDALDLLSARIQSFEATFGDELWQQDPLRRLNAGIQYAMGKNMITTGSANMVTLPTGDLYDIQMSTDVTGPLDEIIRFASSLDVPFTYVYEHPTTYGADKLTGGYAQLDAGDELSDQIISTLRNADIKVIDSRDVLADIPASKIVLRTDQHWTPYAALNVAHAVAGEIGLDEALLDSTQFDFETYEEKFLGKYGQRIGTSRVTPDDYTIFWPNYDTNITRTTNQNGKITEAAGTFRDSVIKWKFLDGDGWNTIAYRTYGLTENFEHFHNEDAPDVTLVVFKDSYGAPIGACLSLVARDVYLVDMRKTDRDALDFVEEINPDHIIMAYSRQMLVLHEYALFHDE